MIKNVLLRYKNGRYTMKKSVSAVSFVKEIIFETVPSLAQKDTQSANTYPMDSIGGGYSLTLTAYNNVLDKFDFKSGNSVTVTKSGNQLRLVSKTAIKNPLVFGASKSLPTVNTVLVYGTCSIR